MKAECLFCFNPCPKVYNLGDGIPGAVHCPLLARQLQNYFVIRQILDIEAAWCEYTLMEQAETEVLLAVKTEGDCGNDKQKVLKKSVGNIGIDSWFRICEDCVESVSEAWKLYQQILALQSKFNSKKAKLKETMRTEILKRRPSRGGCDDEDDSMEVDEEIRRMVLSDFEENQETSAGRYYPVPDDEFGNLPSKPTSGYLGFEDETHETVICALDETGSYQPDQQTVPNVRKTKRNFPPRRRSPIKTNLEPEVIIKTDCDDERQNFDASDSDGICTSSFDGESSHSEMECALNSSEEEDDFHEERKLAKKWKRLRTDEPQDQDELKPVKIKKKPGRKPRIPNLPPLPNRKEYYYAKYTGEIRKKSFSWKTCPQCKIKFKEDETFQQHLDLHKKREDSEINAHLNCSICTYPATDEGDYEDHMRKRHGIGKEKGPPPTWTCPEDSCTFKTTAWKILKQHVETSHPNLIHSSTEYFIQCPDCPDARFTCARQFYTHKKQMHPELLGLDFDCPQCNLKFASQSHVESHVFRVHKKNSRFVCDQCGAGYQDLSRLRRHKEVHSGGNMRKYVCHICALDYTSQNMLNRHLKKHHPAEYFRSTSVPVASSTETKAPTATSSSSNYQCQYCDLSSPYLIVIKRHMQTHKQGLGHKCHLCERCYTNEQGLRRHLRINHGNQEFSCPNCTKKFACTDYLRDHMNKFCKGTKQLKEKCRE